jgi:hypothetical protein
MHYKMTASPKGSAKTFYQVTDENGEIIPTRQGTPGRTSVNSGYISAVVLTENTGKQAREVHMFSSKLTPDVDSYLTKYKPVIVRLASIGGGSQDV